MTPTTPATVVVLAEGDKGCRSAAGSTVWYCYVGWSDDSVPSSWLLPRDGSPIPYIIPDEGSAPENGSPVWIPFVVWDPI